MAKKKAEDIKPVEPEPETETIEPIEPEPITIIAVINPAPMVLAHSLQIGQMFDYKGKTYKKMGYQGDKVVGWCGPSFYDDKAFDLDTMVILK